MEDIVKNIKTGKLLIGSKQTIKALRKGEITKVFLASNCPEMIVDDLTHYCDLASVAVEKLNVACDELGTVCKKPFLVSVIGLLK